MQYKGYTDTMVELDEDSQTIHGRVAIRRGMVTFQGDSAAEAVQAFRDSVDCYLKLCAEEGIEPERGEGGASSEAMTHRGYTATMIVLDEESGTISGEVALSRGAATFEGRTVPEAVQAFRDSVDAYLKLCAEKGIEPAPPTFAGSPALAAHSQ